ncbi:hypothetical protein HPB51_022418 [Rhipicephalus microplus]|uniref:riboflavin kinase n=1 Tax=Rhipicephalus microplus TaxID=6941 RepID=A0A9J6DQE0_RHIMP|nr:hypothetical protein HPB51_022418 [Rhipicephalus microplus]
MTIFPSKLSPNGIKCLPLFLRGTVVKGFGRGSKQLGIPTGKYFPLLSATISMDVKETHIMHKFDEDFYGAVLKVVVLGFLRPEKNFSSLDELISAIKADIRNADENLDREEWQQYKSHKFFSENIANGTDVVRQET